MGGKREEYTRVQKAIRRQKDDSVKTYMHEYNALREEFAHEIFGMSNTKLKSLGFFSKYMFNDWLKVRKFC